MAEVVSGGVKSRETSLSGPTRSRAAKKLQGSVAPMRFMRPPHNEQNAALAAIIGVNA